MSESHAPRIETFLRTVLRRCKLVQLRQIVTGEKPSLVGEYALDDVDIKALAVQIDHDLRRDADDVCGLCKYAVIAIDAEGNVRERMVLRQRGEADEFSAGAGPEEPPTPAGVIAQSMRHTEAFAELVVRLSQSLNSSLLQENARLAAQNERFERSRYEVAELQEVLMSKAHERELESAREQRRGEHQQQILATVVPFVPALLQKFVAHLFETKTLDQTVHFFAGLTPEQLTALMDQGILTKAQKLELDELLERLNRGRGAGARKSPPATSSAENAAGAARESTTS